MGYCDRLLDISILCEMYVMDKTRMNGGHIDVVGELRRELMGLFGSFNRCGVQGTEWTTGMHRFQSIFECMEHVDGTESTEERIGNCIAIITYLNDTSYIVEGLTMAEIDESKRDDNPLLEAARWRKKLDKRTANRLKHLAKA